MADLSVTYMGLKLANPLIVSSSSLTNTVAKVKRCEDSGAGAVVLKSLFEEQIEAQTEEIEDESWPYPHPEAFDYVRQMGMRIGQDDYLKLISDAKKAVSIPVIASLNCITPKWWGNYAGEIARAGADAIELNIAILPTDRERSAEEVERTYKGIIEGIRRRVEIPVAAKIGPYFTALPKFARQLAEAGAAALVLFNRFYQLDIDIDSLALVPGYHLSSPDEIYLPLRWIAILSGQIGCDIAASTGVHDGSGVIKQLLAGAKAVQVCSNLYQKGMGRIRKMLGELTAWMEQHGYAKVSEFNGKMSMESSDKPEYYERLQYIKVFVGLE
ncbi:MAG: dihydroorotate dehydrogenase-like protein [Spirochaetales bacterium]|nr:dihydroorotate dehydrogenase-like protein [Spirochaetales bacterium]